MVERGGYDSESATLSNAVRLCERSQQIDVSKGPQTQSTGEGEIGAPNKYVKYNAISFFLPARRMPVVVALDLFAVGAEAHASNWFEEALSSPLSRLVH